VQHNERNPGGRGARGARGPIATAGLTITLCALAIAGCKSSSSKHGSGSGTTAPTVTSVVPSSGGLGGGESVVLTGTNFDASTSVAIGGNPAVVTSATATSLTVTTPAASAVGTVDVTVANAGGSSTLTGGYNYTTMAITGITPANGAAAGGTSVTITGSNFQDVTSVAPLTSFVVVSPTTITGTIAAGTAGQSVDVSVVSSTQGTAVLNGGFSYDPVGGAPGAAAITALSTTSGNIGGGTTVTIVGANFEPGAGQTVTFGGVAAVILSEPDAGTIVVTTGPHAAGSVDVVVTTPNNGVATLTGGYAYVDPSGVPVVQSVTPTSGPESGGTEVTIRGLNFNNATVARINSAIGNFFVVDATTIRGTTAPRDPSASSSPQVIVDGPVGPSNEPVTFTYTPSLVLDVITPNQGPTSGTVGVTIFGRNFNGNLSDVKFNGVSALSVLVLSDSEALVTTPAGASGPVNVELVSANPMPVPGTIRELAYTYGDIYANPILPGGIRSGQVAPPAYLTSLANVSSNVGPSNIKSRVATGDFTKQLSRNVVAMTVPGVVPGQVFVSGTSGQFEGLITLPAGRNAIDVVWTLTSEDDIPDLAILLDDGTVVMAHFTVAGAAPTTVDAPVGGAIANPTSISTADFNGDFIFDIVICGDATEVEILTYNNGTNLLNPPVVGAVPPLPANSNPIRVIGTEPNGVQILKLDPISDTAAITRLPKELLLDVNRDGNSDVVVLNGNGTISIIHGDGVFGPLPATSVVTFPTGLVSPIDLAATDIDGDKRLDLVVLTQNDVRVFRSSVNTFKLANIAQVQALAFPTGATTTPTSITTGDSNFDCRDDIILGSVEVGGPNIGVYLSNGDGSFGLPILYVAQVAPNMTVGTDVLDVAFSRSKRVYAAANHVDPTRRGLVRIDPALSNLFTGDAPTELTPPTPTGREPRAPRLGDLNDDGRMDMILANFADNTLEVRFGDGLGGFGTPFRVVTSKGPESIALGDVNQDGLPDVVVANDFGVSQPAKITVHLNLGSGAIAPIGTALSVIGEGVREVALRDLDNDGRLDVVTVNQGTNNVSVLLGDPAGGPNFFLPARVYGVQNEPLGLALADMGRPEGSTGAAAPGNLATDGLVDIVVANSGDDSVTILYNGFDLTAPATAGRFGQGERYPLGGAIMGPNVTSPPPALLRAGVEPRGVAVADMNGDGVFDIVTVDQGTSTVTILHGNSANDATTQDGRAISGVTSAANVRKFFIPSDYQYQTSLTDIGQPQVVLPVGAQPQWLRIADMNVDGKLDIIAGAYVGTNLTIYTSGGSTDQNGSPGPPPPATPPTPTFFDVGTAGETWFRSPLTGTGGFALNASTATSFNDPVGAQITGMDVRQVNRDCPPDVAVTLVGDMVKVHKGE